jgi:hypothetical protein
VPQTVVNFFATASIITPMRFSLNSVIQSRLKVSLPIAT